MRKTAKQRFESKVERVPESGCWVWLGASNWGGYGIFSYNNVPEKAHRVSYILHKGPIPVGLHVLHTCDVRCCVNPEHLFLGTRSDNMQDMWNKKRHLYQSPTSKLTEEQVKLIKSLKGLAEVGDICDYLHIKPKIIQNIWKGRTWNYVK